MTTILILVVAIHSGGALGFEREYNSVTACQAAMAQAIAAEPSPIVRATLARHSYCIGAA